MYVCFVTIPVVQVIFGSLVQGLNPDEGPDIPDWGSFFSHFGCWVITR